MKYYYLAFVVFFLSTCSRNIENNSNDKFLDQVKKLYQEGQIDSSLYFRLKIYDKYIIENERIEDIRNKSIYQIIEGLGRVVKRTGTINYSNKVHKDFRLRISKELTKDSLSYKIKYDNRTTRAIEKMEISISTFDMMGSYLQGNIWNCNGADCLNNYIAKLPKEEVRSHLISIT